MNSIVKELLHEYKISDNFSKITWRNFFKTGNTPIEINLREPQQH